MYIPVDDYLVIDIKGADNLLPVRAWKPNDSAGIK